jgi:Flp pilus assembly pilin Flp
LSGNKSSWIRRRLKELWSESGQTMAEYAVVLVVLIPASILLFSGLGDAVGSAITSVAKLLP